MVPSGALYSISGPESDRGAIISVSGRLAPKRIADRMVTAPSIPFPVGFGANLAGSATISVSGLGDRSALFSISGFGLAPKGGGILAGSGADLGIELGAL